MFDSFRACPIPEIARLGRILGAWREQFLAYFTTGRADNGDRSDQRALAGLREWRRQASHTA